MNGISDKAVNHVIIPAMIPVLFLFIPAIPVYTVIQCQIRGLAAIAIAMASGFTALFCAIMAVRKRVNHKSNIWWIATSLILAFPVIELLIFA